MTRTMFHGSPASRIEAILREGIRPDVPHRCRVDQIGERALSVFVVDTEEHAVGAAVMNAKRDSMASNGHSGHVGIDGILRVVVFEIEVPGSVLMVPDEQTEYSDVTGALIPSFRIVGGIPPGWIKSYSLYQNFIFCDIFSLSFVRQVDVPAAQPVPAKAHDEREQ